MDETKNEMSQAARAESTGGYLQRLRLERGLDLEAVSAVTKVSITNLLAIETQDFKNLPADTFTRGLIAIYAEYLQLDPKPIVERFMEERDIAHPEQKRNRQRYSGRVPSEKSLAEPAHISSALIAAVMLLVMAGMFGGFCFIASWNPFAFLTDTEQKEQPGIAGMVQAGSATQSGIDAGNSTAAGKESKAENQAQEPAGATLPYTLTLRFKADSRITVAVDEEDAREMAFVKGEEYRWKAKKRLVVTFSAPDSATILLNNLTVDFPKAVNGAMTLHIPEDLLGQ